MSYTFIPPTIGRKLWYYPPNHRTGDQPLSADIAYVHSATHINIAYFDQTGRAHNAMSVLLVQEDEERPARDFCTWMPFQVGQARSGRGVPASFDPSEK